MTKITCIGEILVDMIGEERKSLAENTEFSKRPGGAPSNAAVAASRLGASVSMAATVGKDEFGEFLVRKLEEEDVDSSEIRRMEEEKTTLAFASLDGDAKPHFSFYRGADQYITESQLGDVSADIVHLGSLPWTNESSAENILEFLEDVEGDVSFDPNLRDDLVSERYGSVLNRIAERIDILIAAEEEVEFFGGLEELKTMVGEIVVTRGEKGAELYTDGKSYAVGAPDVETVDTTGAGDALTGAYLAFRAEGRREALEKAVEAASLSTTSKGAMEALPSRTDLE